MSIFIAVGLLLASTTPATISTAADAPPAKYANEARAGKLHVLQLWSVDQKRFLKQWSQPTPPNLTTNDSVERNKPIFQFIIFDSCQADEAGNCNLTGVITMKDPNGLPYGETIRFPVWDNKPAPPPKVLSLAPAGIGLTVEDGEPLGAYKVRMSVTDHNAEVTATTEVEIIAKEASE